MPTFQHYKRLPNTDRSRCPCCGQLVTRTLLMSLDTNRLSYGTRVWHLGPGLAVFGSMLIDAWPRKVTYGQLADGIYGNGVEEHEILNSLKTYASRLRKILRSFGGDVENVSKEGYQLKMPGRPNANHDRD